VALALFGLDIQLRNEFVDLFIQLRTVFSRARDDQWRSRFIDKNRVDLINDGEGEFALQLVGCAEGHVVSEIIEAKLVVSPVDDITAVGFAFFFLALTCFHHANFQPQEFINRAHPGGISTRQIIVNSDQVNHISSECV